MKAVLINDKKFPSDLVEYIYPHSKLTQFYDNTTNKTLSTLISTPLIGKYLNCYLSTKAATSGNNHPYQLSCKADYASYDSLTNYSYYGRHLKTASKEWLEDLPPIDDVLNMFRCAKKEETNVQVMCPKSTMHFPTFTQHLVDSFTVTAYKKNSKDGVVFDWRKTGSPHNIGLLPLYGKTTKETTQLRLKSEANRTKGRMKTQIRMGSWT